MSFNQYSNTRQEGESFEDYRLRLRSEKFRVKLVRRGVSVWNSNGKAQGTYTKAKAMQLKAAQAMIQIEKDKKAKEEQNG